MDQRKIKTFHTMRKKSIIKAKKEGLKKNASASIKSKDPSASTKKRKLREEDEELEDVEIEVDNVARIGRHSSISSNKSSIKGEGVGMTKKHQAELNALEEADPEFYEYLKHNDASLLEFGADDSDADDDFDVNDDDLNDFIDSDHDDDNEDGDNDNQKKSKKLAKKKKEKKTLLDDDHEVTEDQIRLLMKNAIDGSLTAMKKVLQTFRAACIPMSNQADDEDHVTYAISSPDMYEFIMTHTISMSYKAMYRYLDISDISKVTTESLEKHAKWKSVQILLLSYFKSVLHTLTSLADSVNQGQVAVLLISSLEHYIPLIGPLPRLAKNILKILLTFWSKDLPIAEDNWNMRGHALLRIRQMVIRLPGVIPEECYRAIYLSYARNCKTFTETSCSSILFMAQSVVELYLCDPSLAYQQSFLHIRQLALMVRTAILKKTSESIRQITNWQFLNCLRLWTRMVCAMPGSEHELGALAFPLSQVMFGVMSMASSLYYLPLRYHLITCIHQLAASCRLYIPVAMKLLEVLESVELTTKSTPSTALPPNFIYLVKLPSDSTTITTVRDMIIQQTIVLLRQDVELYRYHLAFPEYAHLIIRKLRSFSKKCKIPKWRDQMKPLMSQIDSFMVFAKEKRMTLGIPSAQVVEFESLLPKNAPDMKLRLAKMLSSGGNINALTLVADAPAVPTSSSQPVASSKLSNKKSSKDNDNVEDNDQQAKKKKKKSKPSKGAAIATSTNQQSTSGLEDEVGALDWLDEGDSNAMDMDG